MATEPVASIVLPYRNSEKTLKRCLNSIQSQTYRDWELIAVNDYSNDDSVKIIEGFQKIDSRIKSLHSPNKGIVEALNFGILSSTSGIIIRMDSDDEMHPDRIHRQVEYLHANPDTGLVSSKISYKAENSEDFSGKGYSIYVDWTNKILSQEEIKVHRFEESPFAHPSVAFRKILIHKYGGYREGNFPEDYELWLRWLSKGVKMEKLNSNLLQWYDSKERLSRTGIRYSEDAFQEVKALYLGKWFNQIGIKRKKISCWGLGKIAKRQIHHISNKDINISKYYEVDPHKVGNTFQGSYIYPIYEIKKDKNEFILILTGSRGAKEKINEFLRGKSLSLGTDYLFLG